MAELPAGSQSHLDAIDIREGVGLILAASSLTTRTWDGCLAYFEDPDCAPTPEKAATAVNIECGIPDVKWISDRRFIAGLDSGAVEVWQLGEDRRSLEKLAHSGEHDDIVCSVSVAADNKMAVTGSWDRRVKLWDLEEGVTTGTYRAHAGAVWCVEQHPTDVNMFLSCSQDGRVLLWDTRKPKPARAVDILALDGIPNCVTWHQTESNIIAVGSESGAILVTNTSGDTGSCQLIRPHCRAVHRLQFSKVNTSHLASCSEDCTVVVTEIKPDGCNMRMRDTQHTDFVQGLVWTRDTNKLYSCGWDNKVMSHTFME